MRPLLSDPPVLLHFIPPCFRFAAESKDLPSLSSFLSRFCLWITSSNPNSRKFAETRRGHVQVNCARSQAGSKNSGGLLLCSLLCAAPEEPLAWEHINREAEQLKALFQDIDKTPCACDEPSPNKDLLSHFCQIYIHLPAELQVLHSF